MTTLKDHTGEQAWVFDRAKEAWRPCVVIGPDAGNPDWPTCPIRRRDGSEVSVGPLELRFTKPSGASVKVLPK